MIFLPLYIDPGTGSMLFSLAIGIVTAAAFAFRALFLKLKFIFSGGKIDAKTQSNKIPVVIYSEDKRYWNIFKPLCDEFEKRRFPVVLYTSNRDDPALSSAYKFVKTEFIGEGNKAFVKLNFLSADIVIATTPGLDVYQWKRSKNVKWYVHIPHSTDELAAYRMFGLDYFDALLATGQNQIDCARKIESLRPSIAKKEIIAVGSLSLDSLKAKFDAIGGNGKNEKKVVLLAPSWSQNGILSRFGAKILSALENTPFEIVVRPHPQTVISEQHILKPLMEQFPNVEWNFDNNNFDALNRADILISDFSGIIFEFVCVFDKPILYADTHFDTLPCDADWLDEQQWCLKVLPSIGFELKESDFPNIENVILNATTSRRLKDGRDNVRAESWSNIGRAAQNAADYIVEKQKKLSEQ